MIKAFIARLGLKKNWNYKENKPLVIANIILASMALCAFLGHIYSPANQNTQADLNAKAAPSAPPQSLAERIKGQIGKNMTLSDILSTYDCPQELINQLVATAKPIYDLRKVIIGNRFEIEKFQDGRLKQFMYEINMDKYLQVDLTDNGYKAEVKSVPFTTRLEFVQGTIQSSLFQAINDLNEGDQVALDMADIFSSDIDFHTDLQPGDRFELLVEKQYLDGKFVKYGRIRAAEFVNRNKNYFGYSFTDPQGRTDYYNAAGQSVRREFLKSPLKFARVSSRFSRRRYHPILKIFRPHLGVDYAAPEGSPVVSAANGRVQFAGTKGGFGKFVQIAHPNGMVTMYGHLSGYGPGIQSGTTVKQGQVIGYVGQTGLATGPHLDYRVTRDGKFINPLSIRSAPSAPLKPEYMALFKVECDKWQGMLFAAERSQMPQQAALAAPAGK